MVGNSTDKAKGRTVKAEIESPRRRSARHNADKARRVHDKRSELFGNKNGEPQGPRKTGGVRKMSSADTTKTGPQTRNTVAQSSANEGTKGIQDQKAKRAKAKMKAKVRAAKPSGVTKVAKNVAKAAKGGRGGLLGLGAAALGGALKHDAKKAKATKGRPKGSGGQMKRGRTARSKGG